MKIQNRTEIFVLISQALDGLEQSMAEDPPPCDKLYFDLDFTGVLFLVNDEAQLGGIAGNASVNEKMRQDQAPKILQIAKDWEKQNGGSHATH